MNPAFAEILRGIILIVLAGLVSYYFQRRERKTDKMEATEQRRIDKLAAIPLDLTVIQKDLAETERTLVETAERLNGIEKDLMHARINIATIFGRINGKMWKQEGG